MKYLQVVVCVFMVLLNAIAPLRAAVPTQDEKGRGTIKKSTETFGLWVEAEGENRPLGDKKEFQQLLTKISNYPFTDVYIQLYRNGRSWFPTLSADSAPFIENRNQGFYPISDLLSFAKKKGIRVHAWLNILRLGDNPNVPLLERAGRNDSLIDCKGTALSETEGNGTYGARPDTPGIWLDPSHPEVVTSIVSVVHDLVSEYPNLAGIHLDMIRTTFPYGGGSWGGEPNLCKEFYTKGEFEKKSQGRGLLSRTFVSSIFGQTPETIDKTEGVTNLVRNIRQYLDWHAPGMELSAAVLSNYSKAKNYAHQDWSSWISGGLVDSVVIMNYKTDVSSFYSDSKHGAVDMARVSIGVGAWLTRNNIGLVREQLRSIKKLERKGIVLFSYSNLADKTGDKVIQAVVEEIKK